MTPAAPAAASQLEGFRHISRLTDRVLHANLEGVTQAESLAHPDPAGNCLNWVVGHMACIQNKVLPLVGQAPVVDAASLDRYDRGSAPMTDPAEARDLGELLGIWDQAAARWDAGLAALPADALAQPAPFSPSGDPDETVGSLLATLLFHQGYHAGQTGVLRRVAGHEGAIK
jgi:hypothetical protein